MMKRQFLVQMITDAEKLFERPCQSLSLSIKEEWGLQETGNSLHAHKRFPAASTEAPAPPVFKC